MSNLILIEKLRQQRDQAMSDFSQLAGQMSAITKYLNSINVEEIKPLHKRVKLLVLMYENVCIENERLKLHLNSKD